MKNAYTRREFGTLTLASAAFGAFGGRLGRAAGGVQTVGGVQIGVQTYSFRALPRTRRGDMVDLVDPVIAAMKECELAECELYAPQVEPQMSGARNRSGGQPSEQALNAREELRRWRLDVPMEHFRDIRRKFEAAGLSIYAYNYSPNASFTDAEIDRGFEMTRALGAQIITASTTLDVARRIAPIADKHRMIVAMHGHSNRTDPNEFCTPESFAAALKMSKYFKINLDIGHFTAAGFDAVAYIDQNHADILVLHLKDRKKNQGDNMPWGEGDTPIRQVLQRLKQRRWPIRAYIEYEHKGAGTPVEEVKTCLAYVKDALA